MRQVLVIAECCANWDADPEKAFRMIKAAKDCGADVAKFQWTSGPEEMQRRRGVDPKYAGIYRKYITYHTWMLEDFKDYCDSVGIEFMCTVFLPQDIPVIAPLVKRFKVSAFECEWESFVMAHEPYKRDTIISENPGQTSLGFAKCLWLHCISKYPTLVQDAKLSRIRTDYMSGFSDHTTSVHTGGWAVHQGAAIVEKHIRLSDTNVMNPDYEHALYVDGVNGDYEFGQYVREIREAQESL